tara:strand:+ start:2726 stop:3007 length:282 start_codon:yes stop_codon:yes gene_type:complete
MQVKVGFSTILDKEDKMLAERYKTLFEIGEYVRWRSICRNENYEELVKLHEGIIIKLRPVDVGGRKVWYADVMENGGKEHLVLLSKIRKVETN